MSSETHRVLYQCCHMVVTSVEHIGDFWNPNPVQNFLSEIRSYPNSVDLSKYLIQSGLYPEKNSDKHFTAVTCAPWISISDQVEVFSIQSNLDPVLKCRIRLDCDPETGSCSTLVVTRYERSHIFQTSTLLLLNALRLLLRLRKSLKHQLRLLLTLRKLPSNPY